MHLMAEPEMSGLVVKCPGCNIKFQIPEMASAPTSPTAQATAPGRLNPTGQP